MGAGGVVGRSGGAGVLAQLGGDGVRLEELVPKLLGDCGVGAVVGLSVGVGAVQAEVGAGEARLGGVEASGEGAEPLHKKRDVDGARLGGSGWGWVSRRRGAGAVVAAPPCGVGARSTGTSSAIRAEGAPGLAGGGDGRAVAIRGVVAGQESDEGGVLLSQGLDREEEAVGAVLVGHGRWTDVAGLLTADWMSLGPAAASGAPRGYAQSGALACLLSLHGASRRANLSEHPLLIRCASEDALTALYRGAPHCPALQGISMLFQTACILLAITQPFFLVTPDGLLARPAPSNAAHLASLDTSAPALRTQAHLLAQSMGLPSPSTCSQRKATRSPLDFIHSGPNSPPRRWTR